MILKALQQKARSLGLGDAQRLTQIATTVIEKTTTDFNLSEALAGYFRYQGFEIRSGNVLSSGNILESKNTGDEKEKDCLQKLKAESAKSNLSDEDLQKKTAA